MTIENQKETDRWDVRPAHFAGGGIVIAESLDLQSANAGVYIGRGLLAMTWADGASVECVLSRC